MKVCVISDTHMPRRAKKLPLLLMEDLEESDLIIHAGDWQKLEVYEELKKFAPVEGVAGNVDGDEIVKRFGRKKILELQTFKIGVVHGDGKGKTTEQRAIDAFEDQKVDVIIFGHSHIPLLKKHGETILFNPGSPTDKRRHPQFSYGVMELNREIKIYHRFFRNKN